MRIQKKKLQGRDAYEITVTELKGWEDFAISFVPVAIGGRRRAESLRIDPADPDDPVGVTTQRLARLPLQRLVDDAHHFLDFRLQPELIDAMKQLQEPGDFSSSRASLSLNKVADVWLDAYRRAEPPRAAVCKRFRIAERTADNYIRKATDAGLIPADLRRQYGKRKPKAPRTTNGGTSNGPTKKGKK